TFSISGMLVWQPSFAQEALTTQYSQSELLKNWALSHCLALVYEVLLWRMTGAKKTEISLASRTLCLDIARRTWSRNAAGILGIP
ncbi:FGGY family carbohydrate kinase, partial [Salmonella enterica subsp. enterica serovar Anatum]|nr:FGGY family carbohydrate kinase [Salmonella enterica subsp. enterica serovar Anatum]